MVLFFHEFGLVFVLLSSAICDKVGALKISTINDLIAETSDCSMVEYYFPAVGTLNPEGISHATAVNLPKYVLDSSVTGAINAIIEGRVKRYGSNCLVHVTTLDTESQLLDYQGNLQRLSSHYPVPLIQTAKDLFIFFVSERVLPLFQLKEYTYLPLSVKDKIFVVKDKEVGDDLRIYHACVYCVKEEENDDRTISFKEMALPPRGDDSEGKRLKPVMFPNYFRNLKGTVLRASVPSAVVARVSLLKLENGEYKSIRGLQLELLTVIGEKLNITFKVRPSTGGGTGLHVGNGSWAGVVGDIYHDRADVGTGVGISSVRSSLIDFVAYYEYISLMFFYGPTGKIYSWKAVFWPLHSTAWQFLIFCMTCTYVTLIIARADARAKLKRYQLSQFSGAANSSLVDQLMYLVVTLMGQATHIATSNPGKLMISFWLFFCIVMSTAYSSKLFSFLAFPKLEMAPQSFEELANSDYGIGLRYIGGAGYNSFQTSTSPALQKIFKRMKLIRDPVECFERTLTSKFACIAYELQFEYSVQKNLSDVHGRTALQKAPDRIFFVSVGLGVQKKAIYAEAIDRAIAFPFQMGLVQRWSDEDMFQIHVDKVKVDKENNITGFVLEDGKRPSPLILENFIGAYTLLFAGAAGGAVIFWIEFQPKLLQQMRKSDRNDRIWKSCMFCIKSFVGIIQILTGLLMFFAQKTSNSKLEAVELRIKY